MLQDIRVETVGPRPLSPLPLALCWPSPGPTPTPPWVSLSMVSLLLLPRDCHRQYNKTIYKISFSTNRK